MRRTLRALIYSALALAALGGCDLESSLPEATGKGAINALNAMPASPAVAFLIEQRALGNLTYKSTIGDQSFDDLTYTFRFEVLFAGDTESSEIATQFIDVIKDTGYTIVLTGSVTAPTLTVWERPLREWDGSETVFELGIAHLSPALGDIDIYVAPMGTAPVLGEERAKLSFGERLPEFDLEEGQYEVIITARDDPATVLYQSPDSALAARNTYTLGIYDADASITGNVSVRVTSATGIASELPDVNVPATLRTVHAAFGTENFDIYADQDFTAPIFSNLGFGESTGDLPVADGTVTYTYTPVGNPGAIIDEESLTIVRGQRLSTFLIGMAGTDLTRISAVDDRRSIDTHARVRFLQAASNFDQMDLYFVAAGTDIAELNPSLASIIPGFITDFLTQPARGYDVILTLPDDKTPIATPLVLDLVKGDVVELLILDTVDPMRADVLISRF